MIQGINFMGREECLTGPIKKAKNTVTNYVAESSVMPELASKASTVAKEEANYATKLNEAYRAARAPYLETPAKNDSHIVMDGQII